VGKKKREEKLKKKALKEWEERRPKTFREALKYFPGVFLRTTLVMVAATFLLIAVAALGLAWAQSFWFQLLVYLGFYLLFQRFIMGPLAPSRIK
jgi:fatty acid desaturase